MKVSLAGQLTQAINRGVKRIEALPRQLLASLPRDGFHARQIDPHLDQQAQLKQLARQRQVNNDQAFFREHRSEIQKGQTWAGRGKDGQLHLLPHSSMSADMMMAVDRTTRIENAPGQYLRGEIEGGGQAIKSSVKAVVDLGVAAAHPQRTFENLQKNHAGEALLKFSRNSERIVLKATGESLQAFCDAQHNPREGGRATGSLGANLVLAAVPLPIPSRLSRFKGLGQVVEVVEHGPKAPPNPGPYPMKIWRHHPNHTPPTGSTGGKPGGIMEALEPRNPRKLRAQIRQAESADLMAKRGYRIEHNPQVSTPGVRNPDYLLEGKLTDHYAPTAPTSTEVYDGIVNKAVVKKQAPRIIVNLADCPVSVQELQKELLRRPIDSLEEVITIQAGEIEHIYP